jgi:hypothetical protein
MRGALHQWNYVDSPGPWLSGDRPDQASSISSTVQMYQVFRSTMRRAVAVRDSWMLSTYQFSMLLIIVFISSPLVV